jgi:hypothetical protein
LKLSKLLVVLGFFFTMAACDDQTIDKTVTEQEKVVSAAEDWEESPMFQVNDYQMIGEEGRLGFIYDNTESTKFYPDKTQKYMWHFWGNGDELKGELKVMAFHKESGEQITVLEGRPLAGPNNGADQHVPSNMSLPIKGLWKLEAYIGNQLFGTVFVKVYED